jgi:hypothetical protein
VHRIQQTRTLAAGVVGAIAASQTLGAAGPLLINGSLASGGVATMVAQQQIGITSTGNLSAINFTITGTDGYGRTVSEVLAGPNNATVKSVLNYLTVPSIVASAAVATAVTVDTVASGASGEIPCDVYLKPFQLALTVEITGTANVTAQFTTDDVFGAAPGPFTWFPIAGLTGITATAAQSLVAPVTAVRLLTNSGAGTAIFSVVQSGAAF